MMDSTDHSYIHSSAQGEVVTPSSRLRVRLFWTAGIVVLLLLLLLTPPLLNVSRLRHSIAASMSASLGRPVHLDGVTLQMLPIPGFVLQNLVVSEDPAFGNEPIIRSNKVLVTLRPSSLWRRRIEVSSVRFQVDDFGTGPTLNLVRNARGEWNLESLLMHAAKAVTASNPGPGTTATSVPVPRFPYVEATNGRINVKLLDEKQPFSLTEADFALWLPSAERWRVRLVGKPARTDTNVADTGTMRLEGELERAVAMADVPVDLRMSWHDAPLGEASKLLTGSDAGWRGTLNLDATLFGPLSAAKLTADVHLNDLRRADFVPSSLLNPNIECNGSFDMLNAILSSPSCALPTPVPSGGKTAGQVVAVADTAELQELHGAEFGLHGLRLGMTNVADSYLLDWARLFSQRIPARLAPGGAMTGSVVLPDAASMSAASWQGEFHGDIEGSLPWDSTESNFVLHPLSIATSSSGLALAPVDIFPPGKPPLLLTGEVAPQGYTLHLAGTATTAQLNSLRALLPPLGEGLEVTFPELKESSADKSLKINVSCSRAWVGVQTCTTITIARPAPRLHR